MEGNEFKNASDLADELGISRTRVTQPLRLLRLAPSVIEALERLGDGWSSLIVGDHTLRHMVDAPELRKLKAVRGLIESR